MSRSQVLTPEQMQAKMAGRPIPTTVEQEAALSKSLSDKKLEDLTEKVEQLKAGKRMTPAELRAGIHLLFEKHDYSPVESLINTRLHTDDEGLGTKIDMFLTEFMLPKLKSVEVSGSVDHSITVVVRRFGVEGHRDEPLKLPRLINPVAQAIDAEVGK